MLAPSRRRRCIWAVFAVALTVSLLPASQQPEPTKAAAVKLPDGTIVFLSKTPDAADAPLDGVLLSPQEYKTLLDQLEQFKVLKANPKAQPPSRCQISGKVEARGERTVAVLSLVYSFRTTAARSVIALGTRGAFPIAAKLGDGKLPVLRDGDDGLVLFVEAAGEHTLTLDVEAPVTPRGTKGEPGFELTLPRAAITTLALAPPTGVKKVTVGVRTAIDRPNEFKQTTEDAAVLTAKADRAGYPLGPAEALSLTWDAPTTGPNAAEGAATSEAEVAVRVSDSQIETIAVLRLRGAPSEWTFVFPLGAVVTAERAGTLPKAEDSPFAATGVVRQPDPAKPLWTFRPPEGTGTDWQITAVVRQARDPQSRGPFAVGPFAVPTAARQSGTVKVFAPPTIALRVKPGPDAHRPEMQPPEEDLRDLLKYATVLATRQPAPLLELVEVRPAPPIVRVQPTFALRPADGGWRLDATLAITPVRTEVSEVVVELPPGWQGLEVTPAELVDAVQEGKETPNGRQYAIQLAAAQKAFTLTVTANFAVELAGTQKATIPLPRFPGLAVQNAKVTATVPEGLAVSGTATTDGGARELRSPNPPSVKPSAVTTVSGQFEKSVSRVELTWHPHRPELAIDIQADVIVNDRQLLVKQVIRVRSPEGEPRPIEFVGPPGAVGLRTVPSQDQPSANAWKLRPPPDAREFTQTVTYALPLPPRRPDQPHRVAVGLFWTAAATKTETTVRIHGGSGRRIARSEGPWRELPPEPIADRDALPWLTLAGTGTDLPLTLELADADGLLPTITVDRALMQAWVDADGKVGVRGRFLLRRWSSSLEVELPAGVTPEFSVDGKKVDPLAATPAGTVRFTLPEPKPGGAGLLLDVRYLLPAAHTGFGELTLPPPRLPGAAYRTPVRWQVALPLDVVALSFDRSLQSDLGWEWRSGTRAPTASATTAELEQWLTAGAEPDATSDRTFATGADALTARQHTVAEVRLQSVPRALWVVACSLGVLLAGLAVSRVRSVLLGPVLGLVGLAAVITAMAWPQPSAQAAGAALPGVAALVLVLAAAAALRWYHRRRITHLPGFTRGLPEPPSQPSGSVAVVIDEPSSRPPLASTGS